MLTDSKLPTMFWTEAVRTACYVLNRVLVTSPHNKTPYALLTGNIPSVSHFKPFGCHVTILNTSDHLGKFDGKADEGYIVGYSASNRAYRVYNVPNKRVEETMNLRYLEEKPNVQGLGHEWYFDLDYLTDTLGYKRDKANQSAGTQEASTNPAGTQDVDSDSECDEQVIIIPSYPSHSIQEAEPKDTSGDEVDDSPLDSAGEIFLQELARLKSQEQRATSDVKDVEELQKRASTKTVPTGSIPVPSSDTTISPGDVSVPTGGVPVPTGSPTDSFFDDEPTTRFPSPSDLGNNEPSPGIFSSSSYDDEFGADLNNLASTVEVSPVATKRINTIHPQSLIIGDHTSAVQTRSKVNKTTTGESAFISYIHDQQRDNHTDFQHCLFACFLSQVEPRSVAQALEDPSWVDAMQEEMQQFKFQNVWVLVDFYLPESKTIWCKDPEKFDLECCQDSHYNPMKLQSLKANPDRNPQLVDVQFLGSEVDLMAMHRSKQMWQPLPLKLISTLNCDLHPAQNLNPISKSSMAALRYRDEHNKVGYLQKPTGSDDYHQILNFLRASHIRSPELGPPAILATIDETPYTITEDSVRSQLQLADDGGIDDLPIAKIYSGMDNLGYVTEGKLTFYKNKFSPQWRFLVHTILHCLSTKSGSWDQFGSSLAVALICLSDGRKFNWSSYIFKGMVSNIGNAKKFLMYPRFLQTILGATYATLVAMLSPKIKKGAVQGPFVYTPRQQTSDPIAPVFEHVKSSDPNIASFSRVHETDDDPFTSTNVEDEPLGGSFHASPPRSTQAPPAGHT
ncbi:putative ribonuclease H-like domain-containing protein [Tanacetum coccineum]